MTHELKIWPEYYEKVLWGTKKWELRKNDRNFKVGDFILLQEFNSVKYTGREIQVEVTYILHGPSFGLEEGYCIMSIE
jgi:hypothetical protein